MKNMKVKDFMTFDPKVVMKSANLKEAALIMKNMDCGFLPVGHKDKVLGVITDRDIVIRAISQGNDPEKAQVSDFMTNEVYGCNEDDFIEDAIDKMHRHNVSRLVVRSKEGELTGIISFGAILNRRAEVSEVANIVKHATQSWSC